MLDTATAALQDAVGTLATVAVRGGLLAWGVFMGKLFAIGFTDPPTRQKILLYAVPFTLAVALGLATYDYFLVVDPGESHRKALYGASKTFFCVLIPLWIGCAWGAMQLADKDASPVSRE
jgi:hypothetical protein